MLTLTASNAWPSKWALFYKRQMHTDRLAQKLWPGSLHDQCSLGVLPRRERCKVKYVWAVSQGIVGPLNIYGRTFFRVLHKSYPPNTLSEVHLPTADFFSLHMYIFKAHLHSHVRCVSTKLLEHSILFLTNVQMFECFVRIHLCRDLCMIAFVFPHVPNVYI